MELREDVMTSSQETRRPGDLFSKKRQNGSASMNKEITIEVPEQVAEAYERASGPERRRVERVVAYTLMSDEDSTREFERILEEAAREAEEHGLTEEKLNAVLDED